MDGAGFHHGTISEGRHLTAMKNKCKMMLDKKTTIVYRRNRTGYSIGLFWGLMPQPLPVDLLPQRVSGEIRFHGHPVRNGAQK